MRPDSSLKPAGSWLTAPGPLPRLAAMTTPARLRAPAAALLLIDFQPGHLPPAPAAGRLIECGCRLAGLAGALGLPALVTEQVPERLGPTVPALAAALAAAGLPAAPLARSAYSAFDHAGFAARLAALDRPQLVVAGCEAAGAVLLTALAALQRGYDVHLVSGGVGGRDPADAELAFATLRQAGGWVTSYRTAACALVSEGAGDRHRAVRAWLDEPA